MGGPGSGRQKAPGARDATVRVVTSLELWEDTVHGFNQMENAAAAYTDKLDDGTPVVRNFADGNFEMAKEVKKAKKDTGEASKELATFIIATQGTASALNQMTGGLRKFQASMKGLNIGSEGFHENMEKSIFVMEGFTGPLETALSLTTLYATYKTVSAAMVTAETAAVNANTTAVVANNVAWYANPLYIGIAAIVAGVALLIYSLAKLMEKFGTLDYILKGVNNEFDKFKGYIEWVGDNVGDMTEGISDFAEDVQKIVEREVLS
tara:strand:- start:30 stop:824 length:795 start_codon:yes stop_codon:yes gene_type:complete